LPRIPITDLKGSLNQGRAPSDLGPSDFTRLRNWYQYGGKLYRRGGMRRLTTAPFSERLTGLLSFRAGVMVYPPSPDSVPTIPTPLPIPAFNVDMIVAGPTRFGVFADGAITAIPNGLGFSIASSTKRWTLLQFKNMCYGIRALAGLVRTDGALVATAGIAAPTAAPVLADGGIGVIPAASFRGVYTYYNAVTNLESDPSPVSNILALGANKRITWTGITASSNPQVTGRRVYRSLPNQSGEYLFVGDIPNNSTTTLDDNVLAQDLGPAVSFTNGMPPPDLLMGAVWRERLWASDGVTLFHSEDGLVEAFDPDAFIPIDPDNNQKMSAICAFGDRLIIGKTASIHYIVGTSPDTFSLHVLTDRHGCISHHTMQAAEGNLFWLDLDNVYRSDGNTVVGIGDERLRDIISAATNETGSAGAAGPQDAVAAILPEFGWYVLAIPGHGQFIYNYRTNVWAEMPTAETIQTIADFYSEDFAHQLNVADDDGHLYRFHDISYGADDTPAALGGVITAEFDSRAFESTPATKHVVERVALLCPQYAETVTLAIVSEGVVVKSRTVSLDREPRWKLYNLSTRHQAKSQSQLRLTYTGVARVELEGFALDLEPINRPSMVAL